MLSSLVKDSGAMYNSFVLPLTMSDFTVSMADFDNEELMKCATPSSSLKFLMASTWFFIKAMRGEITIAVPSISNDGNW